jgi:hypothetical protein
VDWSLRIKIEIDELLPTRPPADLGRVDGPRFRGRLTEAYRSQYDRGRLLDPFERFRQCAAVAVIQVNVVTPRIGDFKADGLSDDESDSLGFELSGIA